MNTENFISRARQIHGSKYDYSKVEYTDNKTEICIICPEHGEFWQRPKNHLKGYGCKKCAKEKISKKLAFTTEKFIEKAKKIYGDKYDYSKVDYTNNHTKICIICLEHGEFWITPNDFLDGHECPKCSKEKMKRKMSSTFEEFIEKAKKIHGNKYNYSKVKYVNGETKVCIICPEHGEFWQTPHSHLNGRGCKKCAIDKMANRNRMPKEEFILRANKVHAFKYDYSKIEYINCMAKVCIMCPEHGEFWQRPIDHLHGHGCSKCQRSFLEEEIMELLDNAKIKYEYNKKYKKIDNLQLDFYIPNKNIGIECQGIQHFKPVNFGHMKNEEQLLQFNEQIKRDKLKKELCEKHNIKLLYYATADINYPYMVYTDKNELLKAIYDDR